MVEVARYLDSLFVARRAAELCRATLDAIMGRPVELAEQLSASEVADLATLYHEIQSQSHGKSLRKWIGRARLGTSDERKQAATLLGLLAVIGELGRRGVSPFNDQIVHSTPIAPWLLSRRAVVQIFLTSFLVGGFAYAMANASPHELAAEFFGDIVSALIASGVFATAISIAMFPFAFFGELLRSQNIAVAWRKTLSLVCNAFCTIASETLG